MLMTDLCLQGGATAMFFSGLGVFYGIFKTCESLDKPSTQPYVRAALLVSCSAKYP
jgi:hypothetical protein